MCSTGCSFLFVNGPPPRREEQVAFDCTESRAAPVLDTIFAILQGANFAFAAASSDEQWAENYNGDPPLERTAAVPLYIAGALLFTGSAYYGYTNTRECRDAKMQVRASQPQRWSPDSGYPSPPGATTSGRPYVPYSPPPGASPYAPPSEPSPYAPPPAPGASPYPPPPAGSQYPPPAGSQYPPPPAGSPYPPPAGSQYSPPPAGSPYPPPAPPSS